MRSIMFVVALAAFLALYECAPPQQGPAVQAQPVKPGQTPSAIAKDSVGSGAAENHSGAGRIRRDAAGQESDLLPSANEGDASPFGEQAQAFGSGRIRVLPAFIG